MDAELETTLQEAAATMQRMNNALDALLPLCPCAAGNPADWDGPQRECPVHGDGETFVAYVQALEALLYAGRGWRTRVVVDHRTPPAAMGTETIELLRAVGALDGA